MKLAAALVHYGEQEQTAATISALDSFVSIHSIIVILHNSYMPLAGSRAVYLSEENRGYGAGLNRAVGYLVENEPDVSLVLAINPDVSISENDLQRLAQSHEESGADCTFPSIAEGKYLIHGYRFSNWGSMQRVEKNGRFFPGTCFLFSIPAWQKVGGFSEDYFHYYEDADFCLRLEQAGCRIHHEPAVVIQHTGKSGADYPATQLPRYAVRNHLLFLRRLGRLNAFSFANVSMRHLLYLFRWKRGWRGIGEWSRGIQEFRNFHHGAHGGHGEKQNL